MKNPNFNLLKANLSDSTTPFSINYAYNFGSLLGILMTFMVISGILLAIHYIGTSNSAFSSVAHVTDNIELSFFIRYLFYSISILILVGIYAHIIRNVYYSFLHRIIKLKPISRLVRFGGEKDISTNSSNSNPELNSTNSSNNNNGESNKWFNMSSKLLILAFLCFLLYGLEYQYVPIHGGYVLYVNTAKLLMKITVMISILDLITTLFIDYNLPIMINPNWDGHNYSYDNIRYYKWLFDLKLLISIIFIITGWLYKPLILSYVYNNVVKSIFFVLLYMFLNLILDSGFVDGVKSQIYGKYIDKTLPTWLMIVTRHRYYRYLFWLGIAYMPCVFYLLQYNHYNPLDKFSSDVLVFGIYYTTFWLLALLLLNLTSFVYKLLIHYNTSRYTNGSNGSKLNISNKRVFSTVAGKNKGAIYQKLSEAIRNHNSHF